MEKQQALRRTALFRELPAEPLARLAERAISQRLQRDQVLFTAGEPARGLYVIVTGSVRASRESSEGREQVIHVERAGATIAEVPMFDGGSFPSTVAAEEETEVLFLDRRDVLPLCREYPDILLAALRVMAQRLRHCAALAETLSLRDVDRRLARWLLEESERQAGALSFELPLTNQQIAARIGTVREVVSRAFSRLQQHGLVELQQRLVTVPDVRLLRVYAIE